MKKIGIIFAMEEEREMSCKCFDFLVFMGQIGIDDKGQINSISNPDDEESR